ncbi:glycosyltransferase family 2 protein [Erythrobacter sp. JK5]|uniref:glycosyltransferase n=1 Tax=Erythrobacter sp. JK5 TaxID=2829500 RepID=UPI001BACC30C|nr:glycosyltransferase [Erythrobacter sp. JK5]QUL37673.1 glycosyltransferase [Erythrobacter sp. JK5]
MTDPAPFTIVIPANNEEAVIARCLEALLEDAPETGRAQIIVAANGCTDRTVSIARETAPEALVLDLAEGSKTKAMNAAHKEASHFPRIFLDADVRCSYHSLAALAEVLREPGVMAASPALRMDLSRSNALVRAYYRVWLTQPYVRNAMVGSGCFGLSQAGFEAIGEFPPITGDDIWVHSRFTDSERRNVAEDREGNPVCFTVSPPRRAIDQIRVETRRRLGNEEVLRLHPSPHFAGSNQAGDLRDALGNGASPVDVAIYLGIKAIARIRARFAKLRSRNIVWERDLAAREV